MTEHSWIQELIPLYALDALEANEVAEIESHLMECEICAAELDSHRAVASALVPDGPAPEHVWDRIQGAIATTGPAGSASVHDFSAERAKRSGPMMWVLGAAAAVALVFGGILVGQRLATNDLNTADGVIAAAEAAAQAPGSVVSEFLVDDVAVARVVLGADGLGYLIPNDSLDPLGSDRTYQLWVLTPEEIAISAGVLGSDPGPATFTWTDDFAGFALTREVAGGVVSSAGDVVSVIVDV
ncbi:MAG: anti-sigma factor [Acidimicrobiia bacterium]